MPISTTSVFTCDRDGTVSAEVAAPENMPSVRSPPEGWMRILWDGVREGDTTMASGTGFLCPACVAAFKEFVGPPYSEKF
jgi:hypothetical protein